MRGDDLRQEFLIGVAEASVAGVDRLDHTFVAGEGDGAVEDLVVAEVGQFDFGVEVDSLTWLAAYQSGQGPAVDVFAFEGRVGELHDLGEEAVDAHEAGERIPERVLVVLVQGLETFNGGLHGGVDLLVVVVLVQDERRGLLHLAGVQDVEVVQVIAGVEYQVRVGGWCDGLAVVHREGIADLVGVVDEIEDERAVLVGVGPVEARQGLHRSEAGQGLVHVHGHQLGLVETGLELLGHHHDPVLVAVEAVGRLGFGKPVGLGLG